MTDLKSLRLSPLKDKPDLHVGDIIPISPDVFALIHEVSIHYSCTGNWNEYAWMADVKVEVLPYVYPLSKVKHLPQARTPLARVSLVGWT
jgi:hypothetical protein